MFFGSKKSRFRRADVVDAFDETLVKSGKLQIFSGTSKSTWQDIWVEIGQKELFVGQDTYHSNTLRSVYSYNRRCFCVVVDRSLGRRFNARYRNTDKLISSCVGCDRAVDATSVEKGSVVGSGGGSSNRSSGGDCNNNDRGDSFAAEESRDVMVLVFRAAAIAEAAAWTNVLARHIERKMTIRSLTYAWKSSFMLRRKYYRQRKRKNRSGTLHHRARKATVSSDEYVVGSSREHSDSGHISSSSAAVSSPFDAATTKTPPVPDRVRLLSRLASREKSSSMESVVSGEDSGLIDMTTLEGEDMNEYVRVDSWKKCSMRMFRDWLVLDFNSDRDGDDDDDDDDEEEEGGDNKCDDEEEIILLSSLRRMRVFDTSGEVLSFELDIDCGQKEDFTSATYEFLISSSAQKRSAGRKDDGDDGGNRPKSSRSDASVERAIDGRVDLDAWTGLLTSWVPRIVTHGSNRANEANSTVLRTESGISGWLMRRVGGLLKVGWKRQWVVFDKIRKTISCFSDSSMSSCISHVRVSKDALFVDGTREAMFQGKTNGWILRQPMSDSGGGGGRELAFYCASGMELSAWTRMVASVSKDVLFAPPLDIRRVRHCRSTLSALNSVIRQSGAGRDFVKITSNMRDEICIWMSDKSTVLPQLYQDPLRVSSPLTRPSSSSSAAAGASKVATKSGMEIESDGESSAATSSNAAKVPRLAGRSPFDERVGSSAALNVSGAFNSRSETSSTTTLSGYGQFSFTSFPLTFAMMSSCENENDVVARLAAKQTAAAASATRLSPMVVMYLLGPESGNCGVRSVLAEKISTKALVEKDAELGFYLCQLVQSIRFEAVSRKMFRTDTQKAHEIELPPLAYALIERARRSVAIASKLMWLFVSEASGYEAFVTQKEKLDASTSFSKSFERSFASMMTLSPSASSNAMETATSPSASPAGDRGAELEDAVRKMNFKKARDNLSVAHVLFGRCHEAMMLAVEKSQLIGLALRGQLVLMDRLCAINDYIASAAAGKDTSAKASKLRNVLRRARDRKRKASDATISVDSGTPKHVLDDITDAAQTLVSPLFPDMELVGVLPEACTVFKSALRPMLLQFDVAELGLIRDHPRSDCAFVRTSRRETRLADSVEPPAWIMAHLRLSLQKRRPSQFGADHSVPARRWRSMVNTACGLLMTTYARSKSSQTEKLWSEKRRQQLAEECGISAENAEQLYTFLFARNKRAYDRTDAGSSFTSPSSSATRGESRSDRYLSSSPPSSALAGYEAMIRDVILAGPLWKKKRSLLSGQMCLRYVRLLPGHLAYGGQIGDTSDVQVRRIALVNVLSVQCHRPKPRQFTIKLGNNDEFVFGAATKSEAFKWTVAIRKVVELVSLAKNLPSRPSSQDRDSYDAILPLVSRTKMCLSPQVWHRISVKRRRMIGLDGCTHVPVIQLMARSHGVSPETFVSSHVKGFLRFEVEHVTKAEAPRAFETLGSEYVGRDERDTMYFDLFSQSAEISASGDDVARDKDTAVDETASKVATDRPIVQPVFNARCESLTIQLWGCRKITGGDLPFTFPIASCRISLDRLRGQGLRSKRCVLEHDTAWAFSHIQQQFSHVDDSASLEDVWGVVGSSLQSLDIDPSKKSDQVTWCRTSSGREVFRRAASDADVSTSTTTRGRSSPAAPVGLGDDEDVYVPTMLAYDDRWRGRLVFDSENVACTLDDSRDQASVAATIAALASKRISRDLEAVRAKGKRRESSGVVLSEDVVVAATEWVNATVESHVKGELCKEIAAIFGATWTSSEHVSGKSVFVDETCTPRISVSIEDSRVVVRSDARMCMRLFKTRSRARERSRFASSTSQRSSSSGSDDALLPKEKKSARLSSLGIVHSVFKKSPREVRVFNCAIAATYPLMPSAVSLALSRMHAVEMGDAVLERDTASATTLRSSSPLVDSLLGESRRILSAVLLPRLDGEFDSEADRISRLQEIAAKSDHKADPFFHGDDLPPLLVELEIDASQSPVGDIASDVFSFQREQRTLGFIFKRGDDVRQDMLILQLVNQIDRWLKDASSDLDLHLTTYEVLAADGDTGLLEMVPGCRTLSGIKEKYGTILKYFQADAGHM
eukprot:g2939.t1